MQRKLIQMESGRTLRKPRGNSTGDKIKNDGGSARHNHQRMSGQETELTHCGRRKLLHFHLASAGGGNE